MLDLVGSQNFGVAPKDLGELVVPQIDLSPLYLLTKQRAQVQIVAVPAAGQNAGGGLVVPAGEVWKVHAGGIFVLCGAGVSGDFTPIISVNGGVTPIADTLSVAANTTRMISMKQEPFWLPAGAELSVYISALVLVPTVSISYLVSRLRA